ncbi:hypothetical protein [Planctomonas deserti]|uniref:hypothetical protein n=1 Tax=Planctomonas deserti TaxID=2144185 RepID=UPI000D3C6B2D|nr:hypothetical protein [Planctomonas deserti]
MQTFELRSAHVADVVKAVADVAVAEDGSFSFEVQVPLELRLGRAIVQAIPDTGSCLDPEALDCPAPTVNLDVRHPASALRDVNVLSTGLATPPLPAHALEDWSDPYYLPGPADGQLTLVLPGSGCETRPNSFVVTAPSKRLEIVSEVQGDACPEIAMRWTSIIEVPDEYAAFDSVTVDNLPAKLAAASR